MWFPTAVEAKRGLINTLRHHYEHLEDRALGKIDGKPGGDTAMQGFESLPILIVSRTFKAGKDTVGLDDEMTELLIAARDYLVKVWIELVARAKARAEAGDSRL